MIIVHHPSILSIFVIVCMTLGFLRLADMAMRAAGFLSASSHKDRA